MGAAKPKAFWPLAITASNKAIPLENAASTEFTANIAEATYDSAESLRAAVQTALGATGLGGTWTVTVSSDGLITIANSVNTFKLEWGSRTTNAAGVLLGWFQVDTSLALSQTASFQHANGWYSPTAALVYGPETKDRDRDRMTVAAAGQNKRITEPELKRRKIVLAHLSPARTFTAFEGFGADTNRALERLWANGSAKFRWWPDGTVEGTSADYFFDDETIREFNPTRMFQQKELYQIELRLRGYVT